MVKKYKIALSEKYVRKSENGKEWFQFPVNVSGQLVAIQTIIPLDPYTEPDLDAISNEAYEKGVQDTKQHWVDAPRSCAYKLGYENGLNDAWEAARTLWNTPNRKEVFGHTGFITALTTLTAQETMEKIRQYEQEKEELEIQGYFKKGEEVIDADGTKAVILRVSEDNYCQVYTEKGCIKNWHIHTYKFHKTGRYFPEVAEVLRKMKETE